MALSLRRGLASRLALVAGEVGLLTLASCGGATAPPQNKLANFLQVGCQQMGDAARASCLEQAARSCAMMAALNPDVVCPAAPVGSSATAVGGPGTTATGTPPTQAPATASASTASPSPAARGTFVAGAPQNTAYAVVVGIEKYGHGLPSPVGARTDAEQFAAMAHASLGIPADHVRVAFDGDATQGTLRSMVAWARDNVPSAGRIYFFFSGHGAPDASGGIPYLVPADADPQYLAQSALPESEVLAELSKGKAREVIVMLDACFSGAGGRSVLPPGARPLVRVKEQVATGTVAVFSSSSGSEISGPSIEGDRGVFTKYVVQGLGSASADVDGDGQISLQELRDWVAPRVAREAQKANRSQNPALTVSSGLGAPTAIALEWGLPAH